MLSAVFFFSILSFVLLLKPKLFLFICQLIGKKKMKRKLEKPAGECAVKICQRSVYNNCKHCPYHVLDKQQTKLRVSHPSVAATVAHVLGQMVSIDDHGQRSRLLEDTKQKITAMKKRMAKPIKHQQEQLSEEHSAQLEYKETTTESVMFRQRVCNAESTITRERRPDGTVLEHEIVRSSTNEQEIEFKREVQKSVSLFLKRVATEQHQWTQKMRDPQYWEQISNHSKARCSDGFYNCGAILAHTDLPLDQSLQQHESQLQAIGAAICAAKPTEVALRTKIEWLAFAHKQLEAYPATAWAIKHCHTIFSGVEQLKAMDAADLEAFTQSPAPPQIAVQMPCSTNDPSFLSRKKMMWVTVNKDPPIPRTTLTDTQLMDMTKALPLYCNYEDALRPPKKRGIKFALEDKSVIHTMAEFVDDIMSGEYTRLLCFIASWQISWRVVHNIVMTELTVERVEQKNGLHNEFIAMQFRDAVKIPFSNPDLAVPLGWAHLTVALPLRSIEVILPDFIALRLAGAQVEQWHKDVYCPAIAARIAFQPRYKEQDFICLDGEQYPRSVVDNAPEFATVLEQLAKKDWQDKQVNNRNEARQEKLRLKPLFPANCYMNA